MSTFIPHGKSKYCLKKFPFPLHTCVYTCTFMHVHMSSAKHFSFGKLPNVKNQYLPERDKI